MSALRALTTAAVPGFAAGYAAGRVAARSAKPGPAILMGHGLAGSVGVQIQTERVLRRSGWAEIGATAGFGAALIMKGVRASGTEAAQGARTLPRG